ncbi:MAG: LamG-like jellyroll fold domain-containing protein [Vicinamibacterales bacterium]
MAASLTLLLTLWTPAAASAQDAPGPVVDAGPDQVVSLPAIARLEGRVAAEGLVTVRWSLVSGPGSAEFRDPTSPGTEVALAVAGTYLLRLNASDGVAAAGDDVTIVVVEANAPPVVFAGEDQTLAIADTATLDGRASDDGRPGRLSVAWSVLGGPGTVTMPDASRPRTTARFGAPGVYVLRLTASDGTETISDDVTVTVTAPNAAPRVSAGPDRSVTLPAAVRLTGTVADDGVPGQPGGLATAWTKVSGPGAVTFAAPDSAATEVRFAVAGAYTLRLTASDGARETHDDVSIAVDPPAAAAGLIAAYGFDEGAGTTIPDGSGHNRTLVRHGATWVPAGRHGGAMAFDGVNDRLDGPVVTVPGTFTFMAWVLNPSALPYETVVTVGTGRTLALAAGDLLFRSPAGEVRLGPVPVSDAWQHVAVTFDGSHLRAFLEAAPLGAPQAAAFESFGGRLHIGAWPIGAAADHLGGAVDDVRLYGRALSAGEIARDRKTPIGAVDRVADTEAPQVEVERPTEDDSDLSDVVTIAALAADDVGVAGVTFLIDGTAVGAELMAAPYWVQWDTRTVANGSHRIEVEARDAAGNRRRSRPRLVTVTNPRGAASNRAPVVSTGGDLAVALPGPVLIDAVVDDDGLPAGPGGYARWSLVSGPDDVRFEPADAPRTTVRFTRPGTYVLRLTVSDGELSGSDDVVVTVTP